ncbi:MAG: peptidoglycan editing factor PgeF [Clostridium sp.]|nr:peptidoglycan editing factor PgeF [Clostridium sp.]
MIIDNKFEFINFKDKNIELNFSTAKNNLDFNMNTETGLENLTRIKDWFGVKDVIYLKQIHSDNIMLYEDKYTMHCGDAIITDKKNIAIGVFTADCVPVILYCKNKHVIAAIHSGWKGTFKKIVLKTVRKMIEFYGVKAEDIVAYIGPHNRSCCYEFGREEAEQFNNVDIYHGLKIYRDGKLDLSKCIEKQLLTSGIKNDNIKNTGICTYCNEEYDLYSYRKQKDGCGRMFSFIFIN